MKEAHDLQFQLQELEKALKEQVSLNRELKKAIENKDGIWVIHKQY